MMTNCAWYGEDNDMGARITLCAICGYTAEEYCKDTCPFYCDKNVIAKAYRDAVLKNLGGNNGQDT